MHLKKQRLPCDVHYKLAILGTSHKNIQENFKSHEGLKVERPV